MSDYTQEMVDEYNKWVLEQETMPIDKTIEAIDYAIEALKVRQVQLALLKASQDALTREDDDNGPQTMGAGH